MTPAERAAADWLAGKPRGLDPGEYVRPCACGEGGCVGFAVWNAHDAADLDDRLRKLGFPPLPDLGYGGAPARLDSRP